MADGATEPVPAEIARLTAELAATTARLTESEAKVASLEETVVRMKKTAATVVRERRDVGCDGKRGGERGQWTS